MVRVFDLRDGSEVASFWAAHDTVNGFEFHPYLPFAATASGPPPTPPPSIAPRAVAPPPCPRHCHVPPALRMGKRVPSPAWQLRRVPGMPGGPLWGPCAKTLGGAPRDSSAEEFHRTRALHARIPGTLRPASFRPNRTAALRPRSLGLSPAGSATPSAGLPVSLIDFADRVTGSPITWHCAGRRAPAVPAGRPNVG